MMVWSKRLAMLAACFAFAACQTQAKKKAPTDTKKPTKTMGKDGTGKPAAPIEEKKPAESFQEVAKDVKEAAQEYLDARAEEKLNPPDATEPPNPDATKIEETGQVLDGAAEILVEMPEEDLLENISNEGGVAITAEEIEEQQSDKKSSPGLKTSGAVLLVAGLAASAVAAVVDRTRLAAAIKTFRGQKTTRLGGGAAEQNSNSPTK